MDEFVEKPNEGTARRYVASGEYLWNAGMFIAKTQRLLDELAENAPELAAGINEIADAWDTPERADVVSRVWPGLERIAIDYTVAEPAAKKGALAVIPGFFGWDDVGDFASVSRVHQAANVCDHEVQVIGERERVVSTGATGIVISETERVVAVAGVNNIIVVDTEDALLVTDRANAQRVKEIVNLLKESAHPEVL